MKELRSKTPEESLSYLGNGGITKNGRAREQRSPPEYENLQRNCRRGTSGRENEEETEGEI